MVRETATDVHLAALAKAILRGHHSKADKLSQAEEKNFYDFWTNVGGIIMREDRIVIPETMENEMLTLAHGGHLGSNKGKRWLRARCWFNGKHRITMPPMPSEHRHNQIQPATAIRDATTRLARD